MTRFYRSAPWELQVLGALTSGAASASEVAARVGRPADAVERLLEQGVAEQAVSRHDLAGAATYSLTPKGLEAVGVYQGVQSAVDGVGHVDLAAATRMVVEQYDAARDVATEEAVRRQAGWPVDDAARDRVSAALNDAFARGALTKDEVDDRTSRALTASTMGELRSAGDGVIELPPSLPTGLGTPTVVGPATGLQVNPALRQVRWRYAAYAVALVVLGLFLLVLEPVVGLMALVAGVGMALWALRPLLGTGRVRVTH